MSLKQKWIDALRFGEYKQGQHNLRDFDDNFCCLGVLCDVIDPSLWVEDDIDDYGKRYKWGGCSASLPYDVVMRFKILSQPIYMMMNDLEGKSFAEIADHIEANVVEVVQ